MMDAEEKEIFRYLRAEAGQFIPINLICRHAGGRQKFRDSPDWAKPALLRMLERGIVEVDSVGYYRLCPRPVSDSSTRHWVAPHIVELLRKSGKKFDAVIHHDGDTEMYYDSL